MKDQDALTALFDKYIHDEMSKKEKFNFEKRLEGEDDLRKELKKYQSLIHNLMVVTEYRKVESNLRTEGFFRSIPQKQKKILTLKRFIAVAASIFFIAISFFGINNYSKKQQLVAESTRILTKTKTNLLGQGAAPFDVAPIRRKKATTLNLEEQLHLNVEDIMAGKGQVAYNRLQIYRASSAYKSLEELDKVDIDWLTTLASFQTGNKTTTKELLKTVLQNPKYEKYAQDLLEQIE